MAHDYRLGSEVPAQRPLGPATLCASKTRKHKGKNTEQDGKGVGGHEVYLSPRIHQEYSFRHRSACRIPADSGQKYLTSGKEYTEPHKTQDQVQRLWSVSTDSKTLDYQRTNPQFSSVQSLSHV